MDSKKGLTTSEPAPVVAELVDSELDISLREGGLAEGRRFLRRQQQISLSPESASQAPLPCAGESRTADEDDLAMPPPYESLGVYTQPESEQQERPYIELNGREILELDSRPMMPAAQLDSVNYETQAASGSESSNIFNSVSNPTFSSPTDSFTSHEGLPSRESGSPIPPGQIRSSIGNARPLLALDTHMDRYRNVSRAKYLSPRTSINVVFTDDDQGLVTAPPNATASCLTTRTLVESAWGALQEHVSSSLAKAAQIPDNPLARQFRAESALTVFHRGLSSLKQMLHGKDPNDPLDYLCVVHTMYAFALVVHEDDMATRCNSLFKQALTYSAFVHPAYSEIYSQVVSTIWQPMPEDQSHNQTDVSPGRSANSKGKEHECHMNSRPAIGVDPLIVVAQNFLDELEGTVVNGGGQGSAETIPSALWSTHMAEMRHDALHTDAFAITANYILQVLSQNFHDSTDLLSHLSVIGQRVKNNAVTTIRRLELEILQASKTFDDSEGVGPDFLESIEVEGHHPQSDPRDTTISECNDPTVDPSQLHHVDSNAHISPMQMTAPQPHMSPADESYATSSVPPSDRPPTTKPEAITPLSQVGAAADPSSSSTAGTPAVTTDPKSSKVEADECCEECGYRPKGAPQWFKGSMAKHKRLQHSTAPPVIYQCPFPGCTSAYKNRPDNLRQHQLEKGHFVDGGDNEAARRPSKKRKKGES
ncbi:hypothetical protein DL766_003811 [Monosporascus sp. MC13-8B]|uniref:C2H2-type domain-containing protein n=1 Tax=Monosporascus cannonballus TaxID=155416 RepID=A0ABY0GWA7_9PEZI|nr:hypothetical protein DL762_009917 [Monosporascus cannonballus]RYO81639.1 hypothetical protein DL763_008518 [Monosporascus cannonballus]RYP32838.1 hypothetical protein DL766_003811 [Monosporascus sp. MC13-8B]